MDGRGSIEKSLCRSKYCGCKANLRLRTEETECPPPPPSGRDTFKSFRCLRIPEEISNDLERRRRRELSSELGPSGEGGAEEWAIERGAHGDPESNP